MTGPSVRGNLAPLNDETDDKGDTEMFKPDHFDTMMAATAIVLAVLIAAAVVL